jgi:hypothetical protein
VEEDKKRLVGMGLQPLDRSANDIFSRTFEVWGILAKLRVKIEWTVIEIEALIQAELSIQDVAPNERGSVISTGRQNRGERYRPWSNLPAVFFDSVHKRVSGRQQ